MKQLTHQKFLEIEDQLIEALASAMETVLTDMGEDIKGISWFSACADDYTAKKYPAAA